MRGARHLNPGGCALTGPPHLGLFACLFAHACLVPTTSMARINGDGPDGASPTQARNPYTLVHAHTLTRTHTYTRPGTHIHVNMHTDTRVRTFLPLQAIMDWCLETPQPEPSWMRRVVFHNSMIRYPMCLWTELGADLHILKLGAPLQK